MSNLNENLKPLRKLTPFGRFCCTIGNLPASYVVSLSYEEQLWWLCDFIQKTVIPAVNNNAEATEEIQELFSELKNYVDNYFKNLDVQDEINNKLDDMATDGTLERIINQNIFNDLNGKIEPLNYHKSVFTQNIINGTSQNVVFAGDSLILGSLPGGAHSPNPPSKLVQDFVNNWYENSNLLSCKNYGIGGALSSAGNSHFSEYLAENPSTIFWSYGTNDMTQNISVDTVISNLLTFYKKCVENNIELIVIIPPNNYASSVRNQKMQNLHNYLLAFCNEYKILYVDMFEYMNNIYKQHTSNFINIQSDYTHFSDYVWYRNAIISKFIPAILKQSDKPYDYIQASLEYNKIKTTGDIVDTSVSPFGNTKSMLRFITNDDITHKFEMFVEINKPSTISIVGYKNNNGDTAVFNFAGNRTVSFNEYNSENDGGTDSNFIWQFTFPAIFRAGMHNIKLDHFEQLHQRFYISGIIIKPVENIIDLQYPQRKEQSLIWTGSSNSLENESYKNVDLRKFNELEIVIGNYPNYQNVILHGIDVHSVLSNTGWRFPTVSSDGSSVEIASFNINLDDKEFSYNSTSNPIRRIYAFNNISHKEYTPLTNSQYDNSILYN